MFWDSSALVPLLIAETRSAQMLTLLKADREPALWWASPIECQSALRRRQRERTLAPAALRQALQRLRQLAEDVDVVAPTDPVRDAAGRSLAAHPLRAADALQLGAALVWCDGASGQGFVCLDDRLREAAGREGFEVVPQN
jgi:predicted nucleic acid-binding protein